MTIALESALSIMDTMMMVEAQERERYNFMVEALDKGLTVYWHGQKGKFVFLKDPETTVKD